MKYLKSVFLFILSAIITQNLFSQDKAEFRDRSNPFFDEMIQVINDFNSKEQKPSKSFAMDFSGYDLPVSLDEFTIFDHTEPHSQGYTGSCWSHAMTSYWESEFIRKKGKKIRISEMFTVYWEYLEKAERFIDKKGDSYFAEGSEANAVSRIWKKYGAVPQSVYSGLKPGQKYHDHRKLFDEMNSYLMSVKKSNAWNKSQILETIKSILNSYLLEPPKEFVHEGISYTPQTFVNKYLNINPDDYVDILSYMQQPYGEFVEYEVPDNWWHNKEYYNVELDVFMDILKKAVRSGVSVPIGGDVSEPGIDGEYEVAIVPDFDIPADLINEYSRQYRFSNQTTTDDHGIHIVGYKEVDGKHWYLIKDSGGRAFQGPNKGYMFYHEDYIKLKIMDFMVPKNIVNDLFD